MLHVFLFLIVQDGKRGGAECQAYNLESPRAGLKSCHIVA